MGEIVSFHAVVRGRVQGVGFRHFARQRAQAHGVAGFVRNLPDGAVGLHAEGAPAGPQAFPHLRRLPPRAAAGGVTRVGRMAVPAAVDHVLQAVGELQG